MQWEEKLKNSGATNMAQWLQETLFTTFYSLASFLKHISTRLQVRPVFSNIRTWKHFVLDPHNVDGTVKNAKHPAHKTDHVTSLVRASMCDQRALTCL